MIRVEAETFPLAGVFRISRGARTEAKVITVEIEQDGEIGRGECVPYARYGETLESVAEQIDLVDEDITREELQQLLPPGAARNAVDCALWDLEAKLTGVPVWQRVGLRMPPSDLITAYTLSLDEPDAMREAAALNADRPLLKIKLGTPDDMPRLEAVREGAPESRIIVDANEGWSPAIYEELAPTLERLGVALVEQPVPAGQDEVLAGLERPVPLCADESAHDRASLESIVGLYDAINIKLDKTGGLTEALALRIAAEDAGLDIMVGCMVGSSLAMAPAVILAQGVSIVDLDGPLLLAEDRDPPLVYDGSFVHPPSPELWG